MENPLLYKKPVMITTTVQVAVEDAQYIKDTDGISYRSVIKAGIKALRDGDRIDFLVQEVGRLKMENARLCVHRDMINFIYRQHPEIYKEARIIINRED